MAAAYPVYVLLLAVDDRTRTRSQYRLVEFHFPATVAGAAVVPAQRTGPPALLLRLVAGRRRVLQLQAHHAGRRHHRHDDRYQHRRRLRLMASVQTVQLYVADRRRQHRLPFVFIVRGHRQRVPVHARVRRSAVGHLAAHHWNPTLPRPVLRT